MKLIIAPDSFKGTNSSINVCNYIEQGVRRVYPDADIVKIPVADGGEGTVDAVISATNGEKRKKTVSGPLGQPVSAVYGVIKNIAVMEMASASGLTLVPKSLRDPLKTTTLGTGELIRFLIEEGFRKIIIGIGGSATNDGGAGMAQGLGFDLSDEKGQPIPFGGGNLEKLVKISNENIPQALFETDITIACDVTNPLLGTQGASYIYGPQKGATPESVKILDKRLAYYSRIVNDFFGTDFSEEKGAGAAGGLGYGLMSFCSAKTKSGIETVLELTGFDNLLKNVDLVITGEGKIDGQSLRGKVPVGVADHARRAGIPVLAIAGDIGKECHKLYETGIYSIMSTVNRAMPLEQALSESSELIIDASERAMRMIKIGTLI